MVLYLPICLLISLTQQIERIEYAVSKNLVQVSVMRRVILTSEETVVVYLPAYSLVQRSTWNINTKLT